MNPLVSVIIPCYNHEYYLDDCFQSLVAQSYDNIEVLVADDCSQDESFKKCLMWKERLEKRFAKVVIYRNPQNRGVCKTTNSLIQQASGKYIMNLASDDALLSLAIEQLVDFYEENDDALLVFGNVRKIKCEDHFPFEDLEKFELYYKELPLEGVGLLDKLFENNYISAPGVFLKKNIIVQFGMHQEDLCFEDWEYWMRLSLHGAFKYLDAEVVLYRENPDSLSHYFEATVDGKRNAERYIESTIKTLQLYEKQVKSPESKQIGMKNAVEFCMAASLKSENMMMVRRSICFAKMYGIRIPIKYMVGGVLLKIHLLKTARKIIGVLRGVVCRL